MKFNEILKKLLTNTTNCSTIISEGRDSMKQVKFIIKCKAKDLLNKLAKIQEGK